MRPVLPSSSPREPFFPAIRSIPVILGGFRKICARAYGPGDPHMQIASHSSDSRARRKRLRAPRASIAVPAYQCGTLRRKKARARRPLPGWSWARTRAPKGRGRALVQSLASPSWPRSARALQRLLNGLIGLFGEFGAHAADLRQLVHVAIVGALGKAALDLDCLLERLGRQKFLERRRALLKRPLGVVGHLGGDRLPALVPLAERLHGSVHVVLAHLLKFVEVEVLEHRCGPVCAGFFRAVWRSFRGAARDSCRLRHQYMQRTMAVNEFCCNATCDTLEAWAASGPTGWRSADHRR